MGCCEEVVPGNHGPQPQGRPLKEAVTLPSGGKKVDFEMLPVRGHLNELNTEASGHRTISLSRIVFSKYYGFQGLPWGFNSKGSACHCRGHGFDPWSGKTQPSAGEPSQGATTREPLVYKRNSVNPTCYNRE